MTLRCFSFTGSFTDEQATHCNWMHSNRLHPRHLGLWLGSRLDSSPTYVLPVMAKPKSTYTSVIETVNFTSQALNGQQRELKIYLPSAYNPKGHYRYPVLYLLHGYPGADTDWLINANLQPVLDRMIANRCQGWASSGNTVQLKIARSLIKSAKAEMGRDRQRLNLGK